MAYYRKRYGGSRGGYRKYSRRYSRRRRTGVTRAQFRQLSRRISTLREQVFPSFITNSQSADIQLTGVSSPTSSGYDGNIAFACNLNCMNGHVPTTVVFGGSIPSNPPGAIRARFASNTIRFSLHNTDRDNIIDIGLYLIKCKPSYTYSGYTATSFYSTTVNNYPYAEIPSANTKFVYGTDWVIDQSRVAWNWERWDVVWSRSISLDPMEQDANLNVVEDVGGDVTIGGGKRFRTADGGYASAAPQTSTGVFSGTIAPGSNWCNVTIPIGSYLKYGMDEYQTPDHIFDPQYGPHNKVPKAFHHGLYLVCFSNDISGIDGAVVFRMNRFAKVEYEQYNT